MLRIPRKLLEEVQVHAREGAPQEVCGILAGRRSGSTNDIERAFRIRNAHERPVGEYLLDPQEQLRTILHVEDELGLEVLGFYHSHPAGPPRFSATDKARANWPQVSYLLVWLRPPVGQLSARWDPERGTLVPEDMDLT